MRVEMSSDGMLTIVPENSVEAFALKHWAQENWVEQRDITRGAQGHWRSSGLMICRQEPDIPQPSPVR